MRTRLALIAAAVAVVVYALYAIRTAPDAPTASPSPVTAPVPSPAPAAVATAAAPAEPAEPPRHAALIERAGDLTAPRVLHKVRAYADDDPPPADRWLWQAAARVELDPQLAESLADTAAADHATHASRELALDLLAHTGHAEAEAALRRALRALETRATPPAFAGYVQRLSFVAAPEPETIELALDLHARAEGDAKNALAYALGGVAGQARVAARAERAAALLTRLRAGVDSGDASAQGAHIGGLGNAGFAEDLARVAARADSPSPEVRAAVAQALRAWSDRTASERLVAFVDDPHPVPQRAALATLRGRALDPALVGAIADRVDAGAPNRTNDPALVHVLAEHVDEPDARRALTRVLARSTDDARLRARVRSILRRAM